MATQFGYECWCSSDGMLEYERHGDGAVCDYPCLGDEVSQETVKTLIISEKRRCCVVKWNA